MIFRDMVRMFTILCAGDPTNCTKSYILTRKSQNCSYQIAKLQSWTKRYDHKVLNMIKKHLPSRFKLLVLALFICATSSMRGQTLYALKTDRKIRFEAKEITAKYQPYLVMGTEQALEFQSTVARFLVKKHAVEQDYSLSPRAKYHLLKRISGREASEMADVLESYRWQEYMRIKPLKQPVPTPIEFGENLVVKE